MLTRLPGWVVDNDTSVREEVAPYRELGPAARWRLFRMCARTAMWATRASGMATRILAQTDPLPDSTVAALTRLRQASGWGHGAP